MFPKILLISVIKLKMCSVLRGSMNFPKYIDWNLHCGDIHVWREAAATIAPWPFIKSKKGKGVALAVNGVWYFKYIFILNEEFYDIF